MMDEFEPSESDRQKKLPGTNPSEWNYFKGYLKRNLNTTGTLVGVFVILSILPMGAMIFVGPGGSTGNAIIPLLLGLSFLFFGCAGLPLVLRKEFEIRFKGMNGVEAGTVFMLIGWGGAIVVFGYLLSKISH
jgi:hypothetical protein